MKKTLLLLLIIAGLAGGGWAVLEVAGHGEKPNQEDPVMTTDGGDAQKAKDADPVATPLKKSVEPAEARKSSETPVDEPVEATPLRRWTTLTGRTFEARLVWVSRSGQSIRFERADGSTFVYAAGQLADEHADTVRGAMVAETSPR